MGIGKYISNYIKESLKVLKNPKQMLPTIVLGIIWLVIALLGAYGINPLPVRILSFLTFAQGGMFGGLIGAVGGIVGKIVVAAFLNAAIVPLFQKKAPFSGISKGIKGFVGSLAVSSMTAVAPLLSGVGIALILYAFMNSNQSLLNSMVGIIAFVMLLQNIGRQGGFLWGLVFTIANGISKGRTPSFTAVTRYLGGMTLGFAFGVALSALGLRWCVWLGAGLLAIAIAFVFVSKNKKEVAAAIIICCMLLPFNVSAEELSVLTDYNNIPAGYQMIGKEDTERSVKGANTYLLMISEKARKDELQYSRDIIYDFSNLPNDSYFHSSKRQEFDNRNARIAQSPGAAMYFHYTDKATGVDEFLANYKLITDEEYKDKSSDDKPDKIEVDYIGDYPAIHCTINYEQVEGYYQNDHWYIPLPTPIAHYGTAYLLLIVSNDVRVYGDVTIDEVSEIYEQWLQESLDMTAKWVDELLKFNYLVRVDNLEFGPIDDDWAQEEDDLAEPEGLQPEPPYNEESQQDGQSTDQQPADQQQANENEEPKNEEVPAPVNEPKDELDNSTVDSNKEETGAGNEQDDHADPTEAAIISIIAILLAILFGNAGGFTPPVSAGAGSPVGGGSATVDDLGKWIKPDADGDLVVTDPINKQERTFVNNGDGTYTDPVSGARYTREELFEQLERRASNADTIRKDEAQFKKNVAEDSERNKTLSEDSKRLEKELQQERDERAHREKVERVAVKLGISGASEKEVMQELERRMERDEEFRQKMHDYAERRDTAVDILEATVDAADYAMAAGEALGGTAGKATSAVYKGVKNFASTVAEKGFKEGAVEGIIKGGTEAATTVMKSGLSKAGVTIGGTVAGDVAEAISDNKDIGEAIKEGFIKGAGNAAVGAVGDAIGDAVEGEGLLNKAAETAEKLAETAYGKEIVDPNIEDKFGK